MQEPQFTNKINSCLQWGCLDVVVLANSNWCPVMLRCIDQPMVAQLNRSIKSVFSQVGWFKSAGWTVASGLLANQLARSRYGAVRWGCVAVWWLYQWASVCPCPSSGTGQRRCSSCSSPSSWRGRVRRNRLRNGRWKGMKIKGKGLRKVVGAIKKKRLIVWVFHLFYFLCV